MTLTQQHHPVASLQRRELMTLLGHAFVSWALCTAAMMIPMALISVEAALVIHAVGAPIFAGVVSWNYYKRFGYTTPRQTAITFVSFVIVVDFFLVALAIERSFEMFASPLGTWIPFALIFGSTYLTGRAVEDHDERAADRR